MRAVSAAVSKAWATFDSSAVIQRLTIAATILATALVVLLASFVAVAMGLT
jgi:hypothetical protein